MKGREPAKVRCVFCRREVVREKMLTHQNLRHALSPAGRRKAPSIAKY
jgi:hypothetical protein